MLNQPRSFDVHVFNNQDVHGVVEEQSLCQQASSEKAGVFLILIEHLVKTLTGTPLSRSAFSETSLVEY